MNGGRVNQLTHFVTRAIVDYPPELFKSATSRPAGLVKDGGGTSYEARPAAAALTTPVLIEDCYGLLWPPFGPAANLPSVRASHFQASTIAFDVAANLGVLAGAGGWVLPLVVCAMGALHGLISFGRGGDVVILPCLVLLGNTAVSLSVGSRK